MINIEDISLGSVYILNNGDGTFDKVMKIKFNKLDSPGPSGIGCKLTGTSDEFETLGKEFDYSKLKDFFEIAESKLND